MDIKEIRRQTGLSQTQFAKELIIPVETIRNWEQGKRKAPDYVKSLIEEVLVGRGYVIVEGRADTVEDIKRVVTPVAKRYGMTKVVLFGSRARGDFNGKSDYDFYTEGGTQKGFRALGFMTDLQEKLHAEIDWISSVPQDRYLLDAIENEGVVIYEK